MYRHLGLSNVAYVYLVLSPSMSQTPECGQQHYLSRTLSTRVCTTVQCREHRPERFTPTHISSYTQRLTTLTLFAYITCQCKLRYFDIGEFRCRIGSNSVRRKSKRGHWNNLTSRTIWIWLLLHPFGCDQRQWRCPIEYDTTHP